VRGLKRNLEVIHTKLNLFRLITGDSKIFSDDTMDLDIKFPLTVTTKIVDKFLKLDKAKRQLPMGMYT